MTITKAIIMIIMRMRIIRMLAVRRESYPVVVVALGRKPLRRKGNLKHVRVNTSINLIQKLALISSARILRILFSFLWQPVVAWHQCMTEFSILNCVMLIIVIIVINIISNNHIIFIMNIIIIILLQGGEVSHHCLV